MDQFSGSRPKEGFSADLVILNANPLEDIRNTRQIHAVILKGRLFDRRALDTLIATVHAKAG